LNKGGRYAVQLSRNICLFVVVASSTQHSSAFGNVGHLAIETAGNREDEEVENPCRERRKSNADVQLGFGRGKNFGRNGGGRNA
jgi:hypothetical protein